MNNKFRYMTEEEILRRQLELLAESSEKRMMSNCVDYPAK